MPALRLALGQTGTGQGQRAPSSAIPLTCTRILVAVLITACGSRVNAVSKGDAQGTVPSSRASSEVVGNQSGLAAVPSVVSTVTPAASVVSGGGVHESRAPALAGISAGALCVTRGALVPASDGTMHVEEPTFRAVVPTTNGNDVALEFRYLGPTMQTSALASGAKRRQLGVKLRSNNGCNVVYVMLRLEPESSIVVSVKRNVGRNNHAECGAAGYRNLKPRRKIPIPRVSTDQPHVLHATIGGSMLRVLFDSQLAWEGELGPEAEELVGPVGVRSDNVRFEFSLRGDLATDSNQTVPGPTGCRPRALGED